MEPTIKFTREEGALAPRRGRKADVAHDLFTSEHAVIVPGRLGATIVSTGIRTAFDPESFGLFINPRGGMMKYPLTLGNTQGVVEGEYRGEVGLPLKNTCPLHFGLNGASTQVLVIDSDGNLVSRLATEVQEEYPEFKELLMNQLYKFTDDLKLIYGKRIIKDISLQLRNNEVIAGTIFIPKGTRLCQAFLLPRYATRFVEVDELDETERGTGAYGSSGVH